MSRKSRGISFERELVHLFWKSGWAAVRIAGSGSMRYPSADVLATNRIRKVAIECKLVNDTKKYFSKDEIEQFKEFCTLFNVEGYLAVKFQRQGSFFFSLEELKQTSNNYVMTLEYAKSFGLRFDELISL